MLGATPLVRRGRSIAGDDAIWLAQHSRDVGRELGPQAEQVGRGRRTVVLRLQSTCPVWALTSCAPTRMVVASVLTLPLTTVDVEVVPQLQRIPVLVLAEARRHRRDRKPLKRIRSAMSSWVTPEARKRPSSPPPSDFMVGP